MIGIIVAVILLLWPPTSSVGATGISLPFFADIYILIVPLFFIPQVMFIITSSSNAVNLTDGLDGLAAGLTAIAAVTFGAFAYIVGNRPLGLPGAVLSARLGGAGDLLRCAGRRHTRLSLVQCIPPKSSWVTPARWRSVAHWAQLHFCSSRISHGHRGRRLRRRGAVRDGAGRLVQDHGARLGKATPAANGAAASPFRRRVTGPSKIVRFWFSVCSARWPCDAEDPMSTMLVGILGMARSGRGGWLALKQGHRVYVSDSGDTASLRETARSLEQIGAEVELGGHSIERLSMASSSSDQDRRLPQCCVIRCDVGLRCSARVCVLVSGCPSDRRHRNQRQGTTTALISHLIRARRAGSTRGRQHWRRVVEMALLDDQPDWVVVEAEFVSAGRDRALHAAHQQSQPGSGSSRPVRLRRVVLCERQTVSQRQSVQRLGPER